MKYLENGEYLRTAEISTEQNYNMIDGRRSSKSGKAGQGEGIAARQAERETGAAACEPKKGCTGKKQ